MYKEKVNCIHFFSLLLVIFSITGCKERLQIKSSLADLIPIALMGGRPAIDILTESTNNSSSNTATGTVSNEDIPPENLVFKTKSGTNEISIRPGEYIEITPSYKGNITFCYSTPSFPAGLKLNPRNCNITGMAITTFSKSVYQITAMNKLGFTLQSVKISSPASHRDIPKYDAAHRIGIYYAVWDSRAANLMNRISNQFTVEDVIQNSPNLKLMDMYGGVTAIDSEAHRLFYQSKPKLGFYCLSIPYESQSDSDIPWGGNYDFIQSQDCNSNGRDVEYIASEHARLMVNAGIDFIFVDASNWEDINPPPGNLTAPEGELSVLRPLQILFREWDKIRNGIGKYNKKPAPTPQIAVFGVAKSDRKSALWKEYLKLYNKYPDLALIHENPYKPNAPDGKPVLNRRVFFFADPRINEAPSISPDQNIVAQIYANNSTWGSLDTIITVGLFSPTPQNPIFPDAVDYKFFYQSPCRVQFNSIFPIYVETTSILHTRDCAQKSTPPGVNDIGSSVTVSPSYQVGYASKLFQSPGKLRGFTMKKQFQTAFKELPNYLLISGWNEHTAQTIQTDQMYRELKSVGLESDQYGLYAFTDGYGNEYSRAIEPVEGDLVSYYDLTSSCIKHYKNLISGSNENIIVNGQDCTDLYYDFVNVHSFVAKPGALDHILSIGPDEVAALQSNGGYNWVCVPYGAILKVADFCTTTDNRNHAPLPFIIFKTGGSDRVQLFRCYNSYSKRHFYSLIPEECNANKTSTGHYYSLDGPLGYISTVKRSETPRPLYRCYNKAKDYHYLASGYSCGDYDSGILDSSGKVIEGNENVLLGYVR